MLNQLMIKLGIGPNLLTIIVYSLVWFGICQFDIPNPWGYIKLLMAIPFIILIVYVFLNSIKELIEKFTAWLH